MHKRKQLKSFDIKKWDGPISPEIQNSAVQALEDGHILYLPNLHFLLSITERQFLTPEKVDPKSKNISYDLKQDQVKGTLRTGNEAELLKGMIRRYALSSRQLLEALIPHYKPTLIQAKTSFRPVEIYGRKNPSFRKDDTLLHVDSFPSNPTKGKRILRVFTNINHEGKSRVWRAGEPFQDVVSKIAPKISHPVWGIPYLLQLLKITKDYRTAYDHYMLQIHDTMKGDAHYQKTVPQEEISFPPGSSWIVFTDQVSHAAISGQHVLEQTFHLPVHGLKTESTAPLAVLSKYFNKTLV